MAETTITSTQVVADWGAYYINNGQSENNIHTRLMESFGTQDAFTTVESEDTVLRETNATFGEVLQSFQIAFTPKGSADIKPKEIKLFNVKIDQAFYPDALKNQWLSFLTSNTLDRTQWPLVRWLTEVYFMKRIKHDMEMKAVFGGKYVAPTAGTANSADQIMDGIKVQINAGITATKVVPIATGALSNDPETFCTQIETFCEGIPELYWSQGLELNLNRKQALRYRRGRRKKYNINYLQESNLMTVEDFTNITIAERASQTGSNKIWTSPKVNSIFAVKGGSNQNVMEVEKIDRLVKMYSDWWVGLGFIDDGLIFTNDQELPTP